MYNLTILNTEQVPNINWVPFFMWWLYDFSQQTFYRLSIVDELYVSFRNDHEISWCTKRFFFRPLTDFNDRVFSSSCLISKVAARPFRIAYMTETSRGWFTCQIEWVRSEKQALCNPYLNRFEDKLLVILYWLELS